MSRFLTSACVALLALLVADIAQAAVITIEGTVKSVDVKKRTITVKTKTKTKTLELDVSRKAKVSVKGKTAKLDSLTPGQEVKISYHEGLEIVLKIEATDRVTMKPKLVPLSELNTPGIDAYPILSPDGMTIYWNACRPGESKFFQDEWVWTAKRKDADSFFENKRLLLKGRHPTLSSDALEIIVLRPRADGSKGESLHAARRKTIDDQFSRPREIREFSSFKSRSPSLSHDGLKLLVVLKQNTGIDHLALAERPTVDAKWGKPRPLRMTALKSGYPSWGCFVGDLGLLSVHVVRNPPSPGKYRFLHLTRKDKSKSFDYYSYIKPAGIIELGGTSPKYVADTNELFFSSPKNSENRKADLWVVKHLELK